RQASNHFFRQFLWDGCDLLCVLDKCLDYGSTLVTWYTQNEQITHLFNRFALPMTWDFAEAAPCGGASGSIESMLRSVSRSVEDTIAGLNDCQRPNVLRSTATNPSEVEAYDVILTDPPYYQAVSYSDLSDFFYVWLRRAIGEQYPEMREALTPKEEEIVQHIREDKKREVEKQRYENGMAGSFSAICRSLKSNGRLVIVFAHKEPDAWETLVSAIIKAGFTVDGSWPIETEMPNRSRGFSFSALSSSVWLVCKKRSPVARAGWDNTVLQQMQERIALKLREFWDAGIRGPDFVWAATGPALEAYSQYPVVKKANKPNELMSVSEFLRHVRRMVLDFVVGRVLSKATGGGEAATEELDDVTTYYLLHRNDFKMDEAPAGACILYCVSCNLSDRDLVDAFDLLAPSGGTSNGDEEEEEAGDDDEEMAEGSSSTFKLKPWNKRKRPGMGYDPVVDSPKARLDAAQGKLFEEGAPAEKPRTRIIPLIDQIHRLMHLWKAGDVVKVDEYLNSKSLRTNALFPPVLQAVIEMADAGSEERSILESLSNHVQGRSVRAAYQPDLPGTVEPPPGQESAGGTPELGV
ncbi:MAG TPA: hypothetical protein PLY00_16865, partial [Verrucomicrobiota bacterium]|nr:hypothetical protein [Verrucomicrobiota bacterium]HPW82313.1 hypothetical protein [Verrucomicrobiota bacterium]HQK02087.1 hypothetical protein [Verrucomicrobiota bacterium]